MCWAGQTNETHLSEGNEEGVETAAASVSRSENTNLLQASGYDCVSNYRNLSK